MLSNFIQIWLAENFDIVIFTETHLLKGERYKLSKFLEYHNSYSTHSDMQPRGGVSCFVKAMWLPYISEIKKDIPDHILIYFTNGSVIFSSYIAPDSSPYYDPTDFSNIANVFTPADDKRIVFGGGDLNARVGDLPSSMSPYGGSYRKTVILR